METTLMIGCTLVCAPMSGCYVLCWCVLNGIITGTLFLSPQESESGSELDAGNDAKERELRERALNSLKKAKKSH